MDRDEDELIARCCELSDQLHKAADLWGAIGPDTDPERSWEEQQRGVMIFALNAVLEFIHDLDGEPRSRMVLLSLLDALLNLEIGKHDPHLLPRKVIGRVKDVVANTVRGEAAAAVWLYRKSGLSKQKACEKVLRAISQAQRARRGRDVLKVSSWTTVRTWAENIPNQKPTPENIAACRLAHLLEVVEWYFPGGQLSEQADWIVNEQIPYSLRMD